MLTNPRDQFRGQSRSPNIVPFTFHIVSSCAVVTLSLRRAGFPIFDFKISWPWNPGQRSLKVIENGTIGRCGTHDFLLTFHSNHRSISYHFRDKRRLPSKIANFSHPVYLTPPLKGFPLELGIGAMVKNAQMMGIPEGRKSLKIGLVV